MCRLAADHVPPGGFWKNPKSANTPEIQAFTIQHGLEFIIKRYNNKSYKQNSPNLGFP